MDKQRGFLTVLIVAAAVAAVAAGALAADSGDGDRQMPAPREPTWTQAPRADAVPRALAERFETLRRGRTARDVLPPEMSARVGAQSTDNFGVNVRFARRASDAHGGLFIVPGATGVCLMSADGPAICDAIETAARGELLGTATGTAHGYEEGEYRVHGLVPDGVDRVVLHMDDGRDFELDVASNAYTIDVKGEPETVEWNGPHGPRELAVPH